MIASGEPAAGGLFASASSASVGMSSSCPASQSVSGCVLCGGASRRMGTDKADLALGEKSLLEQAISQLEPLCGQVLLASGKEARPNPRDLRCVLDTREGAGPLDGIVAALREMSGELLCVLACDMPGAQTEHYQRLLEVADSRSLDACWFRTAGRDEPLFAVYRKSCLPAMSASLESGRYKVLDFLQRNRTSERPLRIETLELSVDEETCSRNLNTPEDLAREQGFGFQSPTES